jgi:hypothetical protein
MYGTVPVPFEVLACEKFLVALAAVEFLVDSSFSGPGPGMDLQVTQKFFL